MVSVILPTYNRAYCLERSISSVLNQSYSMLELIIVDDASIDNTEEVVGKYTYDSRVKYIKLDINQGVAHARNYGVSISEGEWVAFQDSDDVWREEKIEKQIAYANSNPDIDLIFCRYEYHPAEFENTLLVPCETELENTPEKLFFKNHIGAPSVMIKKEFFEMLKGFDTSFPALEDWDFAIKVAMKGKIGYVPEALMDAYQTKGGLSESSKNYYIGRSMIIAKYKEDLINKGIFDKVVMDYFDSAAKIGNLELAKYSLMKELMSN